MKIFLPVDGSVASLAAVHHAVQLVRGGLRATFVLANVQEPPSLYEVVVAHDPAVLDQVRAEAGADLLRTAEAMLDAAGLSYESEVAGGDPGHVLVDLIENYGCHAVVMAAQGAGEGSGAHGLTGATGELGSVTQALLAHSPVPVTVVRPPQPGDSA